MRNCSTNQEVHAGRGRKRPGTAPTGYGQEESTTSNGEREVIATSERTARKNRQMVGYW